MEEFASYALSLPGVEEKPHFDRRSFRIRGRRIFATLHESSHSANLRLPANAQQVYADFGPAIYPVPNKWGDQGWTTFELAKVPHELMRAALEEAHAFAMKKN